MDSQNYSVIKVVRKKDSTVKHSTSISGLLQRFIQSLILKVCFNIVIINPFDKLLVKTVRSYKIV